MAILKIKKYGDSVLRQKCKPIDKITVEVKKLIRDMLDTLYSAPGVGLAASQIGAPVRLCIIDIKPGGKKQPLVMINPRIAAQKGRLEEDEGCLSLPGMFTKIKRYQSVKVEAVNDKGFPIVIEGQGLLSRVLQHEIDHMEGKLFIDYLPWWNRRKIEQEIRRRKKQGEW